MVHPLKRTERPIMRISPYREGQSVPSVQRSLSTGSRATRPMVWTAVKLDTLTKDFHFKHLAFLLPHIHQYIKMGTSRVHIHILVNKLLRKDISASHIVNNRPHNPRNRKHQRICLLLLSRLLSQAKPPTSLRLQYHRILKRMPFSPLFPRH